SYFCSLLVPLSPFSTLFTYTTLFRSIFKNVSIVSTSFIWVKAGFRIGSFLFRLKYIASFIYGTTFISSNNGIIKYKSEYTLTLRSEEHTSELQSRFDLVCRLLLEKK